MKVCKFLHATQKIKPLYSPVSSRCSPVLRRSRMLWWRRNSGLWFPVSWPRVRWNPKEKQLNIKDEEHFEGAASVHLKPEVGGTHIYHLIPNSSLLNNAHTWRRSSVLFISLRLDYAPRFPPHPGSDMPSPCGWCRTRLPTRSRRGHLVIPILSALRSPPVNFRIDSATGFFFKGFAWSGSCLPVNWFFSPL